MLIPLRTEIHARRRPIVTEGLLIINLLVYLAALVGEAAGMLPDRAALAELGHFDPRHFQVWQLFTYQFLHDPQDIWHIAFNLLFLWVFGQAVESRFGRIGFAAFYLGAGAMAGLVHALFSNAPVIGASGCVAGVSGAFLALFPRSHVRVLIIFFVIGVFSIPAMWFIGFYFAIDLISATTQALGHDAGGRVAYGAHIGGTIFGFVLAMVLLWWRVIPRGEFDMVRLWQQARRRAKFRALTQHPVGAARPSASAEPNRQFAAARQPQPVDVKPAPTEDSRVAALRSAISSQLASHDFPAAAESYREMMRLNPEATLPPSQHLDIANQLFTEGDHELAARAYEAILKRSPSSHVTDDVRLMLGLIYSRHIRKPDRARDLIAAVRRNLGDTPQRALADQLLAELGA